MACFFFGKLSRNFSSVLPQVGDYLANSLAFVVVGGFVDLDGSLRAAGGENNWALKNDSLKNEIVTGKWKVVLMVVRH